ncbi:MAG: hypothetical protein NT126_04330 [Bacteroidetes bacterium]|nr:hypothetical protein [Bacteroidota bacterium]
MKKIFFTIVLSTVLVGHVNALSRLYYSAFGFRVGKFNSGVTYKHFYNADIATGLQIDACITHMADGGYTIKGFYFRQFPIKVPIVQLPLDVIYGGGLHLGYFPKTDMGYYKIRHGDPIYYNKDVITTGIDAMVQIEYQVSRKLAPLTVSIDCIPFYEFYNEGPEFIDFGVSVRYTFR